VSSTAPPLRRLSAWLTTPGALRVPEITAAFWVIKALSTAMGEATSDFLVHAVSPVPAVLLGFVAFLASLLVQLRLRRYAPWAYWLAVVMVGTFGTMAADVVHVGLGVAYVASSAFYAAVLAAVFVVWARTEHTLSIHTIDTTRRELFYWAAVVATFAMGTAVGDFVATTLHLGYLASAVIFAVLIAVPALGYRFGGWNAIGCFWTAYVLTRPLGASVADWLGKPPSASGLGIGSGWVALVCGVLIAALVGWLTVTRRDVQSAPA
jgi:uncharacterized membrane-anchored protein